MRTIYIRKDYSNYTRKILIDMAFLSTHKKLRLLKNYYEDNLYFPYFENGDSKQIQKYFLTRDKIISEDANHYFFNFPFKPNQVEEAAY